MLRLHPSGHGHRLVRLRRHRVFASAPLGAIPPPHERHGERFVRLGSALPRDGVVRFHPPEMIEAWHVGSTLNAKATGRDLAALLVTCVLEGKITVTSTDPPRPGWRGWLDAPVRHDLHRGQIDADDHSLSARLARASFSVTGRPSSLDDVARRLDGEAMLDQITRSTPREVVDAPLNSPIRNALAIQIDGFAHYLRTAESSSFAADDLSEIYRRYLPWAVSLDAIDAWNETFVGLRDVGKDVAYLGSTMHAIANSPLVEIGGELALRGVFAVIGQLLDGASF